MGNLRHSILESDIDATPPPDAASLKLNRFDAVSSFFTALILFLGVLVSLAFALWVLVSPAAVNPTPVPITPRLGTSLVGFAQDFEPPGAEEIEELREPSLADTIEAITNQASVVAASPAPTQSNTPLTSLGTGVGGTWSREPGPEKVDVIGPWQRWEIVFQTNNMKDYARQLDFFQIELAAFGGGENGIESASDLSTHPTPHFNPDPTSEKRLYFSWKLSNRLAVYDRQLLGQAGISTAGRNVIRFIPAELESKLTAMEKEHCESHGKTFPGDIAKTVFESHPHGDVFEIRIVQQRHRR